MGKILQFGEGNFLRCFVQYKMQEEKNRGGNFCTVDIVTPIDTEITKLFEVQQNKYHTVLRGKQGGKIVDEIMHIDVINSVVNPYRDFESYKSLYMDKSLDLVISNTTEAGIVTCENDEFCDKLCVSFPAKVTQLLFDRFAEYKTQGGLTFLCVELIENNASELQKCILYYANLWNLPQEFKNFIQENNTFCNTLVDRIVTGHPKDMTQFESRIGKKDDLLVVGEPYFLWVIEGDKSIADKYAFLKDEHIIFTKDSSIYRERKVKILNGSHTMLAPICLLYGVEFVADAMKNQNIRCFLQDVLQSEISPTMKIEKEELEKFTHSIFERFENSFVDHSFWSISLNGISKWKTRNLCAFADYYEKFGKIPSGMTFGLSAMIVFYITMQDKIVDDKNVLSFFFETKREGIEFACSRVLANFEFFGADLRSFKGLESAVLKNVKNIMENGIEKAIKEYENT
ncbi:MAG: tagaturonate reductase [Bacillota bacterium]